MPGQPGNPPIDLPNDLQVWQELQELLPSLAYFAVLEAIEVIRTKEKKHAIAPSAKLVYHAWRMHEWALMAAAGTLRTW